MRGVAWAFPQPAALSVRPALAEVFWLVADFLECLATIKVAVGIRGDDAALAVVARRWRDVQRLEDFFPITAGMASHNYGLGVASLEVQARFVALAVGLMDRTKSRVTVAGSGRLTAESSKRGDGVLQGGTRLAVDSGGFFGSIS